MGELGRSFLDDARKPSAAVEAAIRAEIERAAGGRGGRALRCAFCGRVVTSTDAAIEVDGAHEHVRTNPAGFTFQIGCFCEAPGCAGEGPASEHWSWFPGYAWQAGLCRGCGGHLGWVFRLAAACFYGLITDRLVQETGDPFAP